MNSLLRYSKRTLDSSLLREPYPTNHSYLVSSSFHLLLWILVSVPSPYFFAIGFELYLELDLDETRILAGNSTNHTLEAGHILSCLPLRGYHTLTRLFPEDFASASEERPLPAPHSHGISASVRFVLFPFQSPLLRKSH